MRNLLRRLRGKLWLRLVWRHGLRWLLYLTAAAASVFAVALVVAYLWLPNVTLRKTEIEQRLSAALAHPVTVGKIGPRWRRWYPGIVANDLRIAPEAGQPPALVLPEVRASVAWLPLLWGEIRLHDLVLKDPALTVERIADGRLQVSGFKPFALAIKSGDSGGSANRWLFKQRKVRIEGGSLTWRDALSDEPPFTVNNLQLTLTNADRRHHLDLDAAWPAALCGECRLALDVIFNDRNDWGGQAYLRAHALTLERLPLIARERLMRGIGGTVDARLWSQWRHAAPFSINGDVRVTDLHVPENPWTKPISLAQARGAITWRRGDDYWNAQLGDVFVGTTDRPWLRGAIRVTQEPKFVAAEADYIDVAALMPIIAKVENKPKILEAVRALEPKGELAHFRLRVDGAWPEIENFSVDAHVTDGALAAYERFPGFRGLSGRVHVDRDNGRFVISQFQGDLQFPHVFVAPLPMSAGKGEIAWHHTPEEWEISGTDLQLRNKDGRASGNFVLRLPADKTRSPYLHVDARAPEANAANTALYLPINILKEPVRNWLKQFIGGGKVKDARVILDGPLREFPFDKGGGKFQVSATVNEGVFNYLPGWPAVRQSTAALLFSGSEVLVNGRGNVRGLEVTDLAVRIPDLRAEGGAEVLLGGKIAGPMDNALNVLRSVQSTTAGYIPQDLHGDGRGTADVRLIVPLHAPKAFRLAVDYRFIDNVIDWPSARLHADSVNGVLNFSELGLLGGAVQGKFLGGDAKVDVRTLSVNPLRVHAEAQGKITRSGIQRALGDRLATLAGGNAEWHANVETNDGALQIAADADLQQLAINLPPPMTKPLGVPARLSIRTESSTRDLQLLDVQVGSLASAKLGFARDNKKAWQLARGRVHLGEGRAAWPSVPGVHLSVLWPYTDGDRWSELFQRVSDQVGPSPGSYNDILPSIFTRVSVDIAALELFYRSWGRVAFDIKRDSSAWSGNVRGNNIAGAMSVSGYAYNRTWNLHLDQLTIPARHDVVASPEKPRPVKDLPTLYVDVKSFQWIKAPLGRLAMWARPVDGGWRIQHFVLSRPEMNLFAKGDWSITPESQKTDLDIEFSSDDFGATLAALNMPDQVQGGKVKINAKASWNGGPSDFSIGKVQSTLAVSGERGQFLKIKQGAGKLLGMFDINSLTRYLSLDFSSLFSKGYTFDNVSGNVVLDRGHALTHDFNMRGPSADIGIAGRVGIVDEDFDLNVTVEPHLRSSIAIAGGIAGGPVGLGAALLLEHLLKKPITAGTRLLYTVQGDWANPSVRRVIKEPPVAE